MLMIRLVSMIVVVLCVFMSLPTVAFGFDARCGILKVIIKCDGKLIEGTNIAICRAADAEEVNEEAVYKVTDSFSGFMTDFAWVNDKPEEHPTQAVKLDTYATGNGVTRIMKETDANGEVSFSDLDPGLYLVSKLNSVGDIYTMAPFLVPIPHKNDKASSGWSYLVSARPKVSTTTSTEYISDGGTPAKPPTSGWTSTPLPESTITPVPTLPPILALTSTPTLVDIPDDPSVLGTQTDVLEEVDIVDETPKGELPQTGMLRWPVPVLSSAGILMFVAGTFMTAKNKKRNEK